MYHIRDHLKLQSACDIILYACYFIKKYIAIKQSITKVRYVICTYYILLSLIYFVKIQGESLSLFLEVEIYREMSSDLLSSELFMETTSNLELFVFGSLLALLAGILSAFQVFFLDPCQE